MPRKARELLDGGIYHIFNRGNNRRVLFEGENDFRYFLELMRMARNKYGLEIYHYCLMTNHFHVLMKVVEGKDLARVMHGMQLGYTRYYKKRYGYVGHIFQERYRSPRIAEESYYLQCGRYIERNSVKAGLVKEAWGYDYSSARYYVLEKSDKIVTPNVYYEGMGRPEEERREKYREFLQIEEPYGGMLDDALLKV